MSQISDKSDSKFLLRHSNFFLSGYSVVLDHNASCYKVAGKGRRGSAVGTGVIPQASELFILYHLP